MDKVYDWIATGPLNMTSQSFFSTLLSFLDEEKLLNINISSNFSNPSWDQLESFEEHKEDVNRLAATLIPIFFGLIFVVGVVGNALVIAVLLQMKKRQPNNGLNITYCYILNLAIADSLFLFFCVPFQATVYTLPSWPFGEVVCHGSEFFQKTAMIASIYTMMALSFDRFSAIVLAKSAYQGRANKTSAHLVLLIIWTIALVFGILSIFTRKHVVYGGLPICMPNFKMPTYYLTMAVLVFVLGYVAPLLTIFVCYVAVLIAMTRNSQTTAAKLNKNTKVIKKHVTKVVVMVVIFFALDWFLHHMLILWVEFGDFPFTSATLVLKIIAHCLSYANSSVNPLIYAFVSNQFRKDFKSICPCRKASRAIGRARRHSQNFVLAVQQRIHRANSNENLHFEDQKLNQQHTESYNWKEKMVNESGSSSATAMTNLTPTLTKKLLNAADAPPKLELVQKHNNTSANSLINGLETSCINVRITRSHSQEIPAQFSNHSTAKSDNQTSAGTQLLDLVKSQSCVFITNQHQKLMKNNSCQIITGTKKDNSEPVFHYKSCEQSFV